MIGELKDYIVPGHSEILLRKSTGPLTEFKDHIRAKTPDKRKSV